MILPACRRTAAALSLLLLLLPTPFARAQRPPNLLAGSAPTLNVPAPADATLTTVPAQGAPGGSATALRLTVVKPSPAAYWTVQLSQDLTAPVQNGQTLRLHFWGRSSTGSTVVAVFEQSQAPYPKALNQRVTLGLDWKEYNLAFTTPAYAVGAAGVRFQAGLAAGTLELAAVALEDPAAAPVPPPTPLPAVGGVLLDDTPSGVGMPHPGDAQATSQHASAGAPGGKDALHVVVARPADPDYLLQTSQVVPFDLPDNATLRLHFWARSPDRCPIRAVFEKAADPYTKALAQGFRLTPAWKEYAFAFMTPAYPAGGSAVHFVLGRQAGTVDLAGVRLEYYGVNPQPSPENVNLDLYGGLPHDDTWRAAAGARIRRFRMGGVQVRVVDAQGRPVPGARVRVRQTRSAFLFGTAIAPEPLFAQNSDGDHYRANFLRLFNYAVLENTLKWGSVGDQSLPLADQQIAFCQAHTIPVRGHNLFWPAYQWLPDAVKPLRGQAMRQAVHDHIADYVGHERGKLAVWDVVNEAVTSHEVYDEAGKDLISQAFVWAHQADPGVTLCYNDNEIFDMQGGTTGVNDAKVDGILHYLIDGQKAPVTRLGIQAHMGPPLVPAALLLRNLDHWAAYGLPIEITEFDAGIPDDAQHAAYFDEFLTAMFSHPSVKSFVMWGFWAGAHWRAREGGAMFRQDWSERPAVGVFDRLIHHDWWTDAQGATGHKGLYQTRAFLGTHEVSVTAGGRTKTVTLSVVKNGDGVTPVTVRL